MIYELREYRAAPGKARALSEWFADHVIPLLEKHGVNVLGFWMEDIGEPAQLVCLLGYEHLAAREKAWEGFTSDPEWHRVRVETEEEKGPMVARMRNRILRPTHYSRMK